jgi:hypothetical protein
MHAEALSPDGKKKFSGELPSITSEVLAMIADLDYSDDKLKSIIERMDVSADAKSLFYAIAKTTIRVGSAIVRIGRKIIDCVIKVFEEFPNAGMGLILGGILGVLIGTIPIIGVALGALATPLLSAYGMVLGLKQDVSDKALIARMNRVNMEFNSLKG